jgi:hypothetical protein
LAPATITVTTTNDDLAVDGTVSLREAITSINNGANVNADVNAVGNYGTNDSIDFAIPGQGVQTIMVGGSGNGALPAINNPVLIAGTSQPGYAGHPLIKLDGVSAGSADGLDINASSVVVKGLDIVRFTGSFGVGFGIVLNSSASNAILQANYVGIDTDGLTAMAVGLDGILVNSNNSTIGGLTAQARNVISGNGGGDGIHIFGADNVVEDNYVGVDAMGSTNAVPNGNVGVEVAGDGNTIGGTVAGAGNVVSGNSNEGVQLEGLPNLVAGNFLGTNAAGTALVAILGEGRQSDGVDISSSAANNTVGGTITLARNLISGNGNDGVRLEAGSGTGNLIEGNFIGPDVTGTLAIGNGSLGFTPLFGGVDLEADGNTVGGTTAGAGNVISGNTGDGVALGSSNNLVASNFVGTNAAGTAALANSKNGVDISGSNNNTVGGTVSGDGNVISGNTNDGVLINGGSLNVLEGNFVGTNASGTAALANGAIGVELMPGTSSNTIGGTVSGAANVLSGNTLEGLRIAGSTSTANLVQGNFIGTNAAGTAAVPNQQAGIFLNGAPGNTVDGMSISAPNIISGNNQGGIFISGGAANNVISGNFIGTDVTGKVALGNAFEGIFLGDSPNNTIGGSTTGAGNVISANGGVGVGITGSGSTGDVIQGNIIGLGADGSTALGNGRSGVYVGDDSVFGPPPFQGSASNAVIGGTITGERNVIASNTNDGIDINGSGATGTTVQGNFVGTDVTGTLARPNAKDGVAVEGGATNDTIGGTVAGAGNVLSGNTGSGLRIDSSPTNLVQGNLVGTSAAGTAALPNILAGILVNNATGNTIGGTIAGARNVISGNAAAGLNICNSSSGNLAQGNFIGTDITGAVALGNTFQGVFVSDAPNNTIGGTVAGAGNVISANKANGVAVVGTQSTDDQIQGNLIGTAADGTRSLGNAFSGVFVGDGSGFSPPISGFASNILIGGTVSAAHNVIADNVAFGIVITGSGATGILVEGNLIGTDATGAAAAPNSLDGTRITAGTFNNTIGGTVAGAGNVLSGNKVAGLNISSASANLVQGNLIGTSAEGTAALPNTDAGIFVSDAADNTIGGTIAAARNVISGNAAVGVNIQGSSASGNLLEGNFIGTDVTGDVALGNAFQGVFLNAPNTTIGGTATGAGNVISANRNNGLAIAGAIATGELVQGNLIGLGANGTTPLGNVFDGVYVGDGSGFSPPLTGSASNVTIGGTTAAARNVIGNNFGGVRINGSGATGIVVEGNFLGTDIYFTRPGLAHLQRFGS